MSTPATQQHSDGPTGGSGGAANANKAVRENIFLFVPNLIGMI